ncbi:TPA: hypothetical protein MNT87_005145, partial [Klebsiella pneumoniae]|nr:hypothetical protein [Klebsiella pneumoniae]HBV2226016.1 hypothetical protein [Klebsiella pneumoniae]HBW6205344.1 hypothetical protein [Klebsiella pneumoniae]HBW6685641.1 hypothetical protein [Klebsiella pneumoniae]HCA2897192.1 hypothetical protein [Klebsiella pneumoniae]
MHAEEALTYPGSSPPNILINDQVVLSYRFPSATIAASFTDGDRDMSEQEQLQRLGEEIAMAYLRHLKETTGGD